MRVKPLDTIWHVAARIDGRYPRNWRLLAALNGIYDPFQIAEREYPYQPHSGKRLTIGQEVRYEPAKGGPTDERR